MKKIKHSNDFKKNSFKRLWITTIIFSIIIILGICWCIVANNKNNEISTVKDTLLKIEANRTNLENTTEYSKIINQVEVDQKLLEDIKIKVKQINTNNKVKIQEIIYKLENRNLLYGEILRKNTDQIKKITQLLENKNIEAGKVSDLDTDRIEFIGYIQNLGKQSNYDYDQKYSKQISSINSLRNKKVAQDYYKLEHLRLYNNLPLDFYWLNDDIKENINSL